MAVTARFLSMCEQDGDAIVNMLRSREEETETAVLWNQVYQLDALQVHDAWVACNLLRYALAKASGLELSLNLVWDSWTQYHTELNGGSMDKETLMKMHDLEYIAEVVKADPNSFGDAVPDPLAHYFLFAVAKYPATNFTIHSATSQETLNRLLYLLSVQYHIAECGYDMHTELIDGWLGWNNVCRAPEELRPEA